MSDVTRILQSIEAGDPTAADQLLPLVYDELRKLAAAKMAHEQPGQTLQATALVHDAYLRLVECERPGSSPPSWNSRGHFFAAAAEAMRRILVDNARRRKSQKHGGLQQRVNLDEAQSLVHAPAEDLLALDEALEKLAREDPVKAELVKLRFFGGLSHQEAAKALAISRPTADRYWAYAKVRLYCDIYEPDDPDFP
jgi:RNA polymerase sigma factor (TIGR02999 family)